MKKSKAANGVEVAADGDEQIAAYSRAQTPAFRRTCELLRGLIDEALPNASRKVWHGGPVWFIDGNPVVGYDATAKAVKLLFWNGQAFGESALAPMGTFRAAQAVFADAAEIDPKLVRRWLKKAGADVLDSKALAKQRRAGK